MNGCLTLDSGAPFLAIDRPVDEVEEDVRARKDHPGVLVDGVRVLDDVESTDVLLLLGVGGLTAHRQMDHHVFRFLWNLVQLVLFLLRHRWILGVPGQAVGVSLTVSTI